MAPNKSRLSLHVRKNPDSILQNWASPNPYDEKNDYSYQINQNHNSNLVDHGFNHLDLPACVPQESDPQHLVNLSMFNDNEDMRSKYWAIVSDKFTALLDFIAKENEMGLDPNRRMDKDLAAVELAKPPIPISFSTQELMRDLINIRIRMFRLAGDVETEVVYGSELHNLAVRFVWTWKELLRILPSLSSHKDQDFRLLHAQQLLTGLIGECVVDDPEIAELDRRMTEAKAGVSGGQT